MGVFWSQVPPSAKVSQYSFGNARGPINVDSVIRCSLLCAPATYTCKAHSLLTLCRQFPSNSLRGVHQTKQSRPLQDWKDVMRPPTNFRRVLEPLGNPYCPQWKINFPFCQENQEQNGSKLLEYMSWIFDFRFGHAREKRKSTRPAYGFHRYPRLTRPLNFPPLLTMSAIRTLNPNAEVAKAHAALQININAAQGLQEVLRTNLGPKGTIKM